MLGPGGRDRCLYFLLSHNLIVLKKNLRNKDAEFSMRAIFNSNLLYMVSCFMQCLLIQCNWLKLFVCLCLLYFQRSDSSYYYGFTPEGNSGLLQYSC